MLTKTRSILHYRSWSLAVKITVVFSALITAVIISVGISSYISYKNSILNDIRRFVPQTLEQVNRHLDTYISQMISISQDILKTPYYEFFQDFELAWERDGRHPTIENSLLLNRAIQFVSRGYDQNLLGIIFYSSDGYAYIRKNNGGGNWIKRDYRQEGWYNSTKQTLFILGTKKEVLFEGEFNLERAPYAFTIMQPLPNKFENGISGILQISGDLETVSKILRGMDMGTDSNIYIVDDHGKIFYANDKQTLGQKWHAAYGMDLDLPHDDVGSHVIRIYQEPYLLSYSKSTKTGWTVISTIPLKHLTRGINSVGIWTVVMIVLAVLISVLSARMISYGITNPIRQLSKQLNKLEEHNFQIIRRAERSDEIGILWNAYDGMVNRIRVLIEEVLQSKLLKQESEINALRSQINPHFINNALESIRMTLVRGKYDQVESALVSLGDIMRYQCLQMEELVPARKEIEMVQNVLLIQKIRFGDMLCVEYDIAPEVYELPIPNFVIQPLVENSIKYGASPDDGCIRILINIKLVDGFIIGNVIDEGIGLDTTELENVIESMQNPERGGLRIGLSNIYSRIRLIYNGRGSLTIESVKGAGTIVTLRLPIDPIHRKRS